MGILILVYLPLSKIVKYILFWADNIKKKYFYNIIIKKLTFNCRNLYATQINNPGCFKQKGSLCGLATHLGLHHKYKLPISLHFKIKISLIGHDLAKLLVQNLLK